MALPRPARGDAHARGDAQYTADEFVDGHAFGHSSADYAVALAVAAGARQVALFHHDPARTDDEVERLVADLAGAPVDVIAAREGAVIDLGIR